jgi:hypothetical protein
MSTDFRALFDEHADELCFGDGTERVMTFEAFEAAVSAALAQPEGEGPTEDQLDVVVIAIQSLTPHPSNTDSHNLETVDRGRKILQRAITRWGHPTPQPIPVSERYEFSVYDEEDCEQAGGDASTLEDAMREGSHYLAQYQQDGPHRLELRRVSVLPLPQAGEGES